MSVSIGFDYQQHLFLQQRKVAVEQMHHGLVPSGGHKRWACVLSASSHTDNGVTERERGAQAAHHWMRGKCVDGGHHTRAERAQLHSLSPQ